MKSLILVLIVLVAVARLHAADTDIPHVTVFGTATTKAKPDLLRWNIVVANRGAELPDVSHAHSIHASAVLCLLNEKKIRPEETQTSHMQFSEHREYRGNSWVKEGYEARTQVVFTMRNLGDYREMWLGLANEGAVSVESVTWDVSNRLELQNSTREQALLSARTKAQQMAASLGVKISDPIAIEEVLEENPWGAGNAMTNSARFVSREDEAGEVLAPGSVSIRIRVRVVFQLVKA